jgi:hypothetical protein
MVLRVNHPMLKFVRAVGFELLPLSLDPTLVQVVKNLRPVDEKVHSL